MTTSEPVAALPVEAAEKVDLATPRWDLEAWRRAPLVRPGADPRFEIRRLGAESFEAVYDLVEAAFGKRRPRALFDWLYRRNPLGPARCWALADHDGALVSTRTAFPWPTAFGERRIEGWLGGDLATAPAWQGHAVRNDLADTVKAQWPPWDVIAFSWPNAISLRRIARRGWGTRPLGPVPRLVLSLRRGPSLRASFLRRLGARTRRAVAVHPVRRFDGDFDRATRRGMAWGGVWFPHDADFLNWRYLDHPTREYHARAVFQGDQPAGYCVVALDGPKAMLMELVTAAGDERHRSALLEAALGLAREAGCERIVAPCTPGWRHQSYLRAVGFGDARSRTQIVVSASSPAWCCDLRLWQIAGGDHDAW